MVGGLPIQFDSINDLCIPYESLDWAGGEKDRARVAGGAMGEVFCAEFQGQDVAVKEMKELVKIGVPGGNPADEGGSMDEEMLKDFRAEVELLASCRCPNVVLFVGYCFERAAIDTTSYRLAVVTEYMARGSLWDNLHKRRVRLPYSRRMRMLLDVVKGMQYLRHKKIVHCDLKTPNLLVDRQFLVKVADFGLARLHKDSLAAQLKGEYGTPMWMAPEVLMNESFTFKADVYSFGVVVWEVITGKVPWKGCVHVQQPAHNIQFDDNAGCDWISEPFSTLCVCACFAAGCSRLRSSAASRSMACGCRSPRIRSPGCQS